MDNQEDFLKIQKQLELTNYKLEGLSKLVNLIFMDLGISRGIRVYDQLEELRTQVKALSRELLPGEVKAISYRVDTIKKSLDSIQNRGYI